MKKVFKRNKSLIMAISANLLMLVALAVVLVAIRFMPEKGTVIEMHSKLEKDLALGIFSIALIVTILISAGYEIAFKNAKRIGWFMLINNWVGLILILSNKTLGYMPAIIETIIIVATTITASVLVLFVVVNHKYFFQNKQTRRSKRNNRVA